MKIELKPKNLAIFLIIAFPCGMIASCREENGVGFFIGVLSGIAATLIYPLGKAWYQQCFGGTLRIYKLDIWCKFIMIFSTCFLMITFNFLWMYDSYGFTKFSKDSSYLHTVIVSIMSVVIAICILAITLFMQHLIFNYYLGTMRNELEKSVSGSVITVIVLVGNWLLSIMLKMVQAVDEEWGADMFFIYQACILVVAIISIVWLFQSRILYERKVEEVQYTDGVLPLFLLQGKDSLLYREGKVSLKDLDRLSIKRRDGTELQYCRRFVDTSFLWSKE